MPETLAGSRSLLLLLAAAALVAGRRPRKPRPRPTDPALEARMMRIAAELRCLVCQNQTIADSHAGLAVDLRNQVREQLQQGKSDAQIVDYMTAALRRLRALPAAVEGDHGAAVVRPAALLLVGLGALVLVLRRRTKLAADASSPMTTTIDGRGTG